MCSTVTSITLKWLQMLFNGGHAFTLSLWEETSNSNKLIIHKLKKKKKKKKALNAQRNGFGTSSPRKLAINQRKFEPSFPLPLES